MSRSRSCFATLCLALIVLLLTPAESRAWSAEGHMIVALVADRLAPAQQSRGAGKAGRAASKRQVQQLDQNRHRRRGHLGGRIAREKPRGASGDDEMALRETRLCQPRPDEGMFRQACT